MKITVVLNRGKAGADVADEVKTKVEQITGKPCYVIIRKDTSRLNSFIKKGSTTRS